MWPWHIYPIAFALAFILGEIYSYATHWWFHTNSMYRHVHSVHHQSVLTNPIVSVSAHPFESFMVICALPFMMFFIPGDLFILLGVEGYMIFMGIRNEMGYQFGGKFYTALGLQKLFSTSLYHNLHHTHPGYNLGLSSPVIDKIMGTEYPDYERMFKQMVHPPKENLS